MSVQGMGPVSMGRVTFFKEKHVREPHGRVLWVGSRSAIGAAPQTSLARKPGAKVCVIAWRESASRGMP